MTTPLFKRIPPPRKVALVRASRIGDFICATPAIRALRYALPQAEITLIALPFVRDLVARSPHVDRFVAFPGFPGIAEQFFDARRALEFFAEMQAQHFDLALQLHGTGIYANPFTLMLGAQVTAGFIRPEDPAERLDESLAFPAEGREPQRLLTLPLHLGAQSQGETLEFPLWPGDRAAARSLLDGVERPLVALHPGSRESSKCWPVQRYATLGQLLWRRYGGTIVLVGGEDERPAAAQLASACEAPCLNLTGETSLPVLGAVLEQLTLLVTNDSGPAHVAYALGTPSVTLFAASEPARWGPPPTPQHCVVQAPAAASGQRRIAAIGVEDVLVSAELALAGGAAAVHEMKH